MHQFAVSLAFWLERHFTLRKSSNPTQDLKLHPLLSSPMPFMHFIKLGKTETAKEQLKRVLLTEKSPVLLQPPLTRRYTYYPESRRISLGGERAGLLHQIRAFDFSRERTVLHILERALETKQFDNYRSHSRLFFSKLDIQLKEQRLFDAYITWAYFLNNEWDKELKFCSNTPLNLCHETSPLYPLYGCWLRVSEGRKSPTSTSPER